MKMRVACAVSAAALLTSAAAMAQDKTREQEEMAVSLVGCIQRESDYRRQQGAGTGGFLGLGGGLGDEYVLINAVRGTTGATGDCGTHTTGDAYELSGSREDELEEFVGQHVAITGVMKKADVDVATGRPTGGGQDLGPDLRLFEVEVESFQAMAAVPTETLARVETREPEPQVETPPAPVVEAEVDEGRVDAALPRTASPLTLTGLLGLLSLGGAAGLHAFYRRERRRFR
jgi:hypothetical protein